MMQCDAGLMDKSIIRNREQATRRTTITFPVNTVTAAAERDGERRLRAWDEYREAHSQFSEEERLLLDGIVLSEPDDDR